MADFWHDLRMGARALRKQPGFAAIVAMTLALGIGVNTAVFSVVDAVLLRPPPFNRPDRLVEILQQDAKTPGVSFALRPEAFDVWRRQPEVFERVEGYSGSNLTLTGGMEPELLKAAAVSPGLFALLGVHPKLGRGFQEADAQLHNNHVTLVSETFWRTHLGARPDVIGQTLTLDDQRYTIIGVMPAKFRFPRSGAALWVPRPLPTGSAGTTSSRLSGIARLRDGTTLSAARGRLAAVGAHLARDRPDAEGWEVKLILLNETRVNPGSRDALLVLLGAVGFVLLLSCANAANLLLARASSRQGEVAVRMALGAGRGRLIRQLLAESLILAFLGGTVGVTLAWAGVGALARLVPSELTFLRMADIGMDPRVLAFTVAVTLLTSILTGLLPALRTSRPDLRLGLGGMSGATTADRSRTRLRHALVVGQVALSLVLLVGAGLMMRSFLRLSAEPPGFDPRSLIAANLTLPAQRYQTPAQRVEFFNRVKAILKSHPQVESVSVASGIPTEGGSVAFGSNLEIDGGPPRSEDAGIVLSFSRVDSIYFRTMRIPLLRGREFGEEDTVDIAPAVIVSEEMARRYWPNGNPVGSRMRFNREAGWGTVVGVAANVGGRPRGNEPGELRFYHALGQDKRRVGQQTLIVRTTSAPDALIATVKTAIHTVDKDQPVYRIDLVEARLSEALAEPRFYSVLLTSFASLTLLLLTMGIYGVMAHTVALRTRDIGIRMALGARRNDVLALILRRGLALTLSGIGLGIVASLSLSRVTAAILFGAPAADALTFAAVAFLLMVVALTACWIPAYRASGVDPLGALKHE